MTVFATLAATAATLAALAYLAATDSKRRRVFGLPELGRPRRSRLALLAVLLPGLLLLALGNGAGFVVWLGVVSVAGWGIAALTPAGAARLSAGLGRGAGRFGAGLAGAAGRVAEGTRSIGGLAVALGRMPERIATLEHRVATLEAELARSRAGRSDGGARAAAIANGDTPEPGVGETSGRPEPAPLHSFR